MNLLICLSDPAQWSSFYEYKLTGGHLSPTEQRELAAFIQAEGYREPIEAITQGKPFAPPRKSCISKMHSDKKRIVYTYAPAENWVLKLLTFLLQQKYDRVFAPNLYSFRPHLGVKNAIREMTCTPRVNAMWSYKVDIHNYFNSVPIGRMLPLLQQTLSDEPILYRFLEALLTDPLVEDHGTLIQEEKGIMAGTPLSTFLANLYLSPMDHFFAEKGVPYARYSDDILLFEPSQSALQQDVLLIRQFLSEAGLSVNPKKEQYTAPGEPWSFLGIRCQNGTIDLSPVSVEKLKAKMRRKTRALMRWKARKGADGPPAARAFIRTFRRKLFENPVKQELTWSRWYFPLITTADSLKILDAYSQQCIRYLATGTRTRAAYNFRYEDMKALGYISLVNRYWAFRSGEPISGQPEVAARATD